MRREWLWVQGRRAAAVAAIVAGLGASISSSYYVDVRAEGPSAVYQLAQLTTPVHEQMRLCTSITYLETAAIEFDVSVTGEEPQDFTLPVRFAGTVSGEILSAELSPTLLHAQLDRTIGTFGSAMGEGAGARCSEWFDVQVGPLTGSAGTASVNWSTAATTSADTFDVPEDGEDSDLVWVEVATGGYLSISSDGPTARLPLVELDTPVRTIVRVCTPGHHPGTVRIAVNATALSPRSYEVPVQLLDAHSGLRSSKLLTELSRPVHVEQLLEVIEESTRPCTRWLSVVVGPVSGEVGRGTVTWTISATADFTRDGGSPNPHDIEFEVAE